MAAFLSSAGSMTLLLLVLGIGMFPELVHGNGESGMSLTAYNAASSRKTLGTMLVLAGVGMPLVLGYTVNIYRVFRGKVKITSMSY
jgi:cytochrome d ubiquinol oxidase subunit II